MTPRAQIAWAIIAMFGVFVFMANVNLRTNNRDMLILLRSDADLLRYFATQDTLVLTGKERAILRAGAEKIDAVTHDPRWQEAGR